MLISPAPEMPLNRFPSQLSLVHPTPIHMDFSESFTPHGFLVFFTTYLPVIISFLLFPIYCYVSYQNRSKDKETAIFLITNHFFKVNCLVHFLAYPIIPMAVWVVIKTDYLTKEMTGKLPIQAAVLSLLLIYLITTSVCSFLIVYMAIQRFILYVIPTIGDLLTIKRTWFFIAAYIFLPVLSFGAYLPYAVNYVWDMEQFQKACPKCRDRGKLQHIPVFIVSAATRIVLINTLTFISAILYLIMIWKIQKFKKMMSQTTIKPEKYIMYQVIILSVWQIHALFMFFARNNSEEFFTVKTIAMSVEATVTSTFPSIQMSYLLCNRANVTEMWKMLMRIIGYQTSVTPHQVSVIRSTNDAL